MGLVQQRRPVGVLAKDLAPKIQAALTQLVEAYDYAQDAGRDVWDFAVEIRSLKAAGLTASDLRWLVCKGYVEHAHEITAAGEEHRAFRLGRELKFSKRTCFVLTEAGLALARVVCDGALVSESPDAAIARPLGNGHAEPLLPRWDRDLRELRVGGQLVKRFKLPAPNQMTILTAFEEEGWPPRIDDPLPPQPEQDPKRRLNDTIKSLNHHHRSQVIRFVGDGTGKGVRWELLQGSFFNSR